MLNVSFFRLWATALLILGLSGCSEPEVATSAAPLRVTVVSPQSAEMQQTLSLSGTLSARESIAVGTPLQGVNIVAVYAEMGDRVKKGQLLARLENVNTDAQLRQTQAQLNRARAQLRSQQAVANEAAATLKRYRKLIAVDAVSRQELEQQTAAAATAAANVEAAKADIAQLQAQLDDDRNQQGKTDILAPADGVIARRNAEAGGLTGTEALFTLIKDGTVELIADVGASDLPLLQSGMKAEVNVRGVATPLQGTVRLVSPEMDSNTRLGKVRIALPAAESLYTGAYAQARVQLPSYHAPLALPTTAVMFDRHGAASVFTVDEQGSVSRQAVEIGRRQGEQLEIKGLTATQAVVRQAGAFINEGDVVSPVFSQGAE